MKRALTSIAYQGAASALVPMISEKTNPHHQQDIKMPLYLLLTSPMEAVSKRRRVSEIMEDSGATPMDISSYDNDENMNLATEYHHLLDLPTEMLAHIFSFLPLQDLCRSSEICTATYSVVRFYTLSVALQVKCREFMEKNEKLIKDLIFTQNEHIEVLKKLVEFYRGEIPIPKPEVDKLQLRQAELHMTERTLTEQRDGIQKNIAIYSDQYKACTEVKTFLLHDRVS
eukprot:Phypoly_transcript_14463.p1 GENE.Phypoly_transcript_14463~~Phypoly_transcript_14463.p1  ORF type:complete len:228 (-),score=27.88 Phypoly_transcript_14463:17-700(-)